MLTDRRRAGIEVTINARAIPGDDTSPVTSYTVTITGEHGLVRLVTYNATFLRSR